METKGPITSVQEPGTEGMTSSKAKENIANRTRIVSNAPKPEIKKAQSTIKPGTLLQERYRIEFELGAGGISHIFRARDTFLEDAAVDADANVAIKVLQDQFVNQPEALRLLMQEAKKTQQLTHPNIIRLYDVSSSSGTYFLVMEYLDGDTLEQIINRNKPKGLPFKSAFRLIKQIASALEYAHQKGIVHADLKPANVIVDRKGHVTLLDFGVSQKVMNSTDVYAADHDSETPPVSGYTPAYASAEVQCGAIPEPTDDIYSFGCLVYELLTSKHPYGRTPAHEARKKGLAPKKPSHLSYLQWRALRNALSYDPNKRPNSITEFIALFGKSYTPTLLGLAAGIFVAASASSYYSHNQNLLSELRETVFKLEQQHSDIDALAHLTPNEVLSFLNEEANAKPIIWAGTLKYHSEHVLRHFEERVDGLLKSTTEQYPDYPAIDAILGHALQLYPDSYQLADLRGRVARSKQSTIGILESQLTALLSSGTYHATNGQQDPTQILYELKRIEPGYQPVISEDTAGIFLERFNSAMEALDAASLDEMIGVGSLFFSAEPSIRSLLDKAKDKKNAITKMSAYQSGQLEDFPYDAAAAFYHGRLQNIRSTIEASTTGEELDEIYEQWKELETTLPSDFEPGIRIRRQLSDKYLAVSRDLLEANQVRTAERLMRRASELMNRLD